jgi:hypothetical protein
MLRGDLYLGVLLAGSNLSLGVLMVRGDLYLGVLMVRGNLSLGVLIARFKLLFGGVREFGPKAVKQAEKLLENCHDKPSIIDKRAAY